MDPEPIREPPVQVKGLGEARLPQGEGRVAVSIPVTASGGCGRLEHFSEAVLEGKAAAVLAASVFHFGEITVPQVKEHLRSKGLPVDL